MTLLERLRHNRLVKALLELWGAIPPWTKGLTLALLVLSGTLYLAKSKGWLAPQDRLKPGIAEIISLIGFLVVIFQLYRGWKAMRMGFVSNYLSRFFLDRELCSIYYDLVQEYPIRQWKKIHGKVLKHGEKLEKEPDRIWQLIEKQNQGREEGRRHYHPAFFQGSPEEQRLDRLLGYFDIVAFHVIEGEVKLNDVKAMLGYHLHALATSPPIQTYLEVIQEAWETNPAYRRRFGDQLPFYYLRKLLDRLREESRARIAFRPNGR